MNTEEIRKAVEALPRRANGKIMAVPETLRVEILTQAKESEGGMEAVAHAIGISPITICGWRTEKHRKDRQKIKRGRKFHRVVIAEEREKLKPTFVVEGPGGLRILGLGLSEVAFLLKGMSHESYIPHPKRVNLRQNLL